MLLHFCTSFLLLIFMKPCICLIDPVSVSVAAGLGLLGYNFQYVKDQTYCRLTECCNEDNIPGDINELSKKLDSKLFGQHIVRQHLVPALRAHFSSTTESKKPLVISFHGTPGTGKTYVADFIAKSLYKRGLRSKYVHKYLGRADFSKDSDTHLYQERINREIRAAIAECPRSLFIFEEVDKMPPGIFDSLTALVNHNTHVKDVDFSKAIYILLSNTASIEISEKLADLIIAGKLREDTKLSDFDKILELVAYNRDGGMKKTSLIEAHVIDHYIPFLPLERSHIEKCLEAEYNRWGRQPDQKAIEDIISNSITFERRNGLFATSGCKTLEKKVAAAIKFHSSEEESPT